MHKQKTALMTLENAIYDLDTLIWEPDLCARSFVTELERLYESLLKQEPRGDKTSYSKLYVKLKSKMRRAKYTRFRDMFRRYDSTFRAGVAVTVDNWTVRNIGGRIHGVRHRARSTFDCRPVGAPNRFDL